MTQPEAPVDPVDPEEVAPKPPLDPPVVAAAEDAAVGPDVEAPRETIPDEVVVDEALVPVDPLVEVAPSEASPDPLEAVDATVALLLPLPPVVALASPLPEVPTEPVDAVLVPVDAPEAGAPELPVAVAPEAALAAMCEVSPLEPPAEVAFPVPLAAG